MYRQLTIKLELVNHLLLYIFKLIIDYYKKKSLNIYLIGYEFSYIKLLFLLIICLTYIFKIQIIIFY